MKKTLLDKFISKYSLSGTIEAVAWDSDGSKISTKFATQDMTVVGFISTNEISLPQGEYNVFETSKLISLLRVLDDDIEIDVKTDRGNLLAFLIKDSEGTKITSVLASPSAIPKAAKVGKLPPSDVTITIDDKFISKFVKGASALRDSESFTVKSDASKTELIIGYDAKANTNRVNIPVVATASGTVDALAFNTEYFRSILMANKECESGTMEITANGVATIRFTTPGYDILYYLTKVKS